MIKYVFGKIFEVLAKKPVKLWGISLLGVLLTALASVLGVLPIITIPATVLLGMGLSYVLLSAYYGNDVKADDLFYGFGNFWRNAGGLCWEKLWIFIWSLIPVVGIVFGIIKSYAYKFNQYILLEDNEISAGDALRKSQTMTEGIKGKMFLTDLLIGLIPVAVGIVLGLLGMIPVIGVLFTIILVIFLIVYFAFKPLISGLATTVFYDEAKNGIDFAKYDSFAAQKAMERDLKAQVKAQMEAEAQARVQAQLQAQQAAAAAAQQPVQPVQPEQPVDPADPQ